MEYQKSLFMLFFLFVLGCGRIPNDEKALYSLAKEKYTARDYNAAIKLLDTLIARNTKNDSAYYLRGLALLMLNDKINAYKDFTHLIDIGSSFQIKSLEKRIEIDFDNKDFDAAYPDIDFLISIDSTNYYPYYARGLIKLTKEISGENPDSTTGYFFLETGEILYYDYRGALADFNKAIALNPKKAILFIRRGNVFEKLKESDRALADYNQAVSIEPGSFEAYYTRALFFKSSGDFQKSLSDFTSAIKIKPDDPFVYMNRGFLKKEFGDKNGACDDFSKARSLGYSLSKDDIDYCK